MVEKGSSIMSKKSTCLKLFTSTLRLSAFTFGGGYVIIPLMKKQFVDDLEWIDEEEMMNLTAIAQAAPGPVAVNAAILLGFRVAGKTGAFISILGTILPPLFTLSIISLFYTAFRENVVVNAVLKGMNAGVAAIIVNVVWSLGGTIVKEKDIVYIGLMLASFMATYIFEINIFFIVIACGFVGAIKSFRKPRDV